MPRDCSLFPSGNAKDRRRQWRARGRLLEDALAGRATLQRVERYAGPRLRAIAHFPVEPVRPAWARRLSRGAWRDAWEWAASEYPMARAFRAARLREEGDEAGAKALYRRGA